MNLASWVLGLSLIVLTIASVHLRRDAGLFFDALPPTATQDEWGNGRPLAHHVLDFRRPLPPEPTLAMN
ncbi:hypothetical protein [Mycolicibacterium pyrenivorans]|uniref:hypothetical protein n=1 Tax=Mycolicibacterium pyrenivorans TaxID=187102 RepID=UPI0021F2D1D2|nr:hypothetical protein [Mycolicibacterium pyrenivorans]MCV7150818.1 hypothetical protein [Mycolicibacterium pyrenivorans]